MGLAADATAPDHALGRSGRRVAIVVIACALPQYDRAVAAIRRSWGSVPSDRVDVFYAYGTHPTEYELVDLEPYAEAPVTPVPDMQVQRIRDLLLCGCSDVIWDQLDALLRKRLLALEYLTERDDHAAIYTVCATSYVDKAALLSYVDGIQLELAFHGPLGASEDPPVPYVSGSSMLFSPDLACRVARARDEIIALNAGEYADDVAISRWVAANVSTRTEPEIAERIAQWDSPTDDNTFRMMVPANFIDFRSVPAADQMPTARAPHYHFVVDKIEDMESFHQRHFA